LGSSWLQWKLLWQPRILQHNYMTLWTGLKQLINLFKQFWRELTLMKPLRQGLQLTMQYLGTLMPPECFLSTSKCMSKTLMLHLLILPKFQKSFISSGLVPKLYQQDIQFTPILARKFILVGNTSYGQKRKWWRWT
jgi:hypothetical protein